MSIVVFAGPSIKRTDAVAPGIEFLPPAAEGDLYRAALQGPKAIGVIDGYFESQPALWHKEILWALSQGIHVFGASSMGALRAAELWTFGMIGVGAVFRAYRRGIINDDAEVAVQHGPAEIGYPSITEALVNVRATLSRAMAHGIITPEERANLFQAARAIYYKDRTWEKTLLDAVASGWPADRSHALRLWLKSNRVDVKRTDGCALIRRIAALNATGSLETPHEPMFGFEDTTFWQSLVDRHEAS